MFFPSNLPQKCDGLLPKALKYWYLLFFLQYEIKRVTVILYLLTFALTDKNLGANLNKNSPKKCEKIKNRIFEYGKQFNGLSLNDKKLGDLLLFALALFFNYL